MILLAPVGVVMAGTPVPPDVHAVHARPEPAALIAPLPGVPLADAPSLALPSAMLTARALASSGLTHRRDGPIDIGQSASAGPPAGSTQQGAVPGTPGTGALLETAVDATGQDASAQTEAAGTHDPLQGFNRVGFALQQELDKLLLRPAAMGYQHVVPEPMRDGIRNFLRNLTEPIVFLNDLLQLRPKRALRTLARFAVNSTIGLAGLFDPAKGPDFKLPYRANGFGDTLGYYGVKPGPYLFLPLVGPTDLRDLLGGTADGAVLPVGVGHPFDTTAYQVPSAVLGGLDQRARADQDLKALFSTAVDPYATLRSVYRQSRRAQIRSLKLHTANHASASPDASDPLSNALDDPAAAPHAPASVPQLDDPLTDPAASGAGTGVHPQG